MKFDHDPAAGDRRGRRPERSEQPSRNQVNAVAGDGQMTYSWRSQAARILVAIVIGGVIAIRLPEPWAAHAATDESTRYYERAQGYLAKGELQAAIIELKNSVRADPTNAAALYALGVSFLRTGD